MQWSALSDVYIDLLGVSKYKLEPDNWLDQTKMNINDLTPGNTNQGIIPSREFDYSVLSSSEITNDVQTNQQNQNLSTN